jgi:hypothetical protein
MKLLIENWRKFINEQAFPTNIEEKNFAVFDFDHTLAYTESSTKLKQSKEKDTGGNWIERPEVDETIKIIKNQKDQDDLKTDMENNPEKYEGAYFDFSDFSDIQGAEYNKEMVDTMAEYRKDPNAHVIILTARDPIAEDAIRAYLNEIGIDTSEFFIKGISGGSKGDYILNTVENNPSIKKVLFWDDSEKNVNDVENKLEDTDIELDVTLVKKSIEEKWSPSERKKRAKKCDNPKGFTMKQFCKGRK